MYLKEGIEHINNMNKKLTKEEPSICKNCANYSKVCGNESSRYFKEEVSIDFTCEEIEIFKW